MEFVTYLCLLLSTIQLSVANHTGKALYAYSGKYLSVQDVFIPPNSIWRGIILEPVDSVTYSGPNWFIHYLHEIPRDSPIRLDYTLQYEDEGWFWNSWKTMHHGAIRLCDETEETQDASILWLVRQVLHISKACPVLEGTAIYTNGRTRVPGETLNFAEKQFWLSYKIQLKRIRILTNIWNDSSAPIQNLFRANFYYDGRKRT